jgi:hypothetical protein
MNRKAVIFTWFPGLQADLCIKVLDPYPGFPNKGYNCYVFALWHRDRHIIKDNDSLDEYIKDFEDAGYRCYEPRDTTKPEHSDLEPGIEKVALYARDVPGRGLVHCTHAAKQLSTGWWASKLVICELIEHSLTGLEDSDLPLDPSAPSVFMPFGHRCGRTIEENKTGGAKPIPLRFGIVAVVMWRKVEMPASDFDS